MLILKIAIIGSKGQLGKELQDVLYNNYQLFTYDLPELDITDLAQVKKIIFDDKPDIVINCAAYTDVDGCESNEHLAYKANALGPKNLAVVTAEIETRLVHVSTDYVFNGKDMVIYREDSKTDPINVYGKSKLLGEKFVEKFNPRHFIIRTAWLYGDGNNFVRTMLRLAREKKELSVVDDQIGSPTSTTELARVIKELMITEYYGLYHGTCQGKCSWYEFAKKIFEIKGIDIKVKKVTSEEFKRPAERPKFSVLDNFMLELIKLNLFKEWEEALFDYLQNEEI